MQAADAPRLAAMYFVVQAALVPLWWIMLFAVPGARAWFLPAAELDPAFVAFVAPDLVVLAVGSAVAGALGFRTHVLARPAAWFAVGAVMYATVYTLAWTVLVEAPVLSAVLMVTAAGMSIGSARLLPG